MTAGLLRQVYTLWMVGVNLVLRRLQLYHGRPKIDASCGAVLRFSTTPFRCAEGGDAPDPCSYKGHSHDIPGRRLVYDAQQYFLSGYLRIYPNPRVTSI